MSTKWGVIYVRERRFWWRNKIKMKQAQIKSSWLGWWSVVEYQCLYLYRVHTRSCMSQTPAETHHRLGGHRLGHPVGTHLKFKLDRTYRYTPWWWCLSYPASGSLVPLDNGWTPSLPSLHACARFEWWTKIHSTPIKWSLDARSFLWRH